MLALAYGLIAMSKCQQRIKAKKIENYFVFLLLLLRLVSERWGYIEESCPETLLTLGQS